MDGDRLADRVGVVADQYAKGNAAMETVKVHLTPKRIGDLTSEGKAQSFLWSADVQGLGIRTTASGARSYIFQASLRGKTMRVTIGNVDAWSILDAQKEARRLRVMVDQGDDPRQARAAKDVAAIAFDAAKKANYAADILRARLESVTVQSAWLEYIEARKSNWGTHHLLKHERAMQRAGIARQNGGVTVAGELESLADTRLHELTSELVADWAKCEALTRPSSSAIALSMMRAFLAWCQSHKEYKSIVTSNITKAQEVTQAIGKVGVKHDALQREQLAAWFDAVKSIGNPIIAAYLQSLLLVGARREEWSSLKWDDVDFQWNTIKIKDKVEEFRTIPLTPYVAKLLSALPRINRYVFNSQNAASGYIAEPSERHNQACAIAGVEVTLHGLRRSFASLCEWIEMPVGISAQIQGHKPQGVREQHYIRRPIDLLRMWHVKIETWILEQSNPSV